MHDTGFVVGDGCVMWTECGATTMRLTLLDPAKERSINNARTDLAKGGVVYALDLTEDGSKDMWRITAISPTRVLMEDGKGVDPFVELTVIREGEAQRQGHRGSAGALGVVGHASSTSYTAKTSPTVAAVNAPLGWDPVGGRSMHTATSAGEGPWSEPHLPTVTTVSTTGDSLTANYVAHDVAIKTPTPGEAL